MEPGSVGLALSYAVTLTGMFQWGVRQSAEIENMVRTLEEEMFGMGYLLSSYMKIIIPKKSMVIKKKKGLIHFWLLLVALAC